MTDNLRSKVIRLAHANPSLRPHLLPLLGVRVANKNGKVKKNEDGSYLINLPSDLENESYERMKAKDREGQEEVAEKMYSWISKKTKIPVSDLKSKYDWNSEDLYEPVHLVPRS